MSVENNGGVDVALHLVVTSASEAMLQLSLGAHPQDVNFSTLYDKLSKLISLLEPLASPFHPATSLVRERPNVQAMPKAVKDAIDQADLEDHVARMDRRKAQFPEFHAINESVFCGSLAYGIPHENSDVDLKIFMGADKQDAINIIAKHADSFDARYNLMKFGNLHLHIVTDPREMVGWQIGTERCLNIRKDKGFCDNPTACRIMDNARRDCGDPAFTPENLQS